MDKHCKNQKFNNLRAWLNRLGSCIGFEIFDYFLFGLANQFGAQPLSLAPHKSYRIEFFFSFGLHISSNL